MGVYMGAGRGNAGIESPARRKTLSLSALWFIYAYVRLAGLHSAHRDIHSQVRFAAAEPACRCSIWCAAAAAAAAGGHPWSVQSRKALL